MPKSRRPTRDYPIGYARPPKAHQFPPGRSGNPRGRPSGSPTIDQIVLREAGRLVGIQVGDNIQRIPRSEAVIRKLFMLSMEGNPTAIRLLLPMLASAQASQIAAGEVAPELDLKLDAEAVRLMITRLSKTGGVA